MSWSAYIIINRPNGVLYIGESNRLKKRLYQYKNKVHPSTFSATYNLDKLVCFENYGTKDDAKLKEIQIKEMEQSLVN